MKRITTNLVVAILAFGIGTLSWFANPLRQSRPATNEPLLVTITPKTLTIPKHGEPLLYVVSVKNVSDKTVRGYSLSHTCNCRSWDSNDVLYPDNVTFTNPVPLHQILLPGESQDIPMSLDGRSGSRVWLDLVHFEHGENWGPNRGHKEGYVRE
jgi:hypothetical protein